MKRSTSIARHATVRIACVAPRPRVVPPTRSLNSAPSQVGDTQLHGIGRRHFLMDIMGVLSNPAETVRSLSEAKHQVEEMQQELKDAKERSQIPASHTFSPLPGFFDRPNEIKAIERALGSIPSFTVLFGASSVGKTALLRQVLSNSDRYHVLHFDLRIAGFADLPSLYFSLAQQLESYFAVLPEQMGAEWGWDIFEKESWAFKHDRLEVAKRVENGGQVKTSDIARLMEMLQSSLLTYWDFKPMLEADRKRLEEEKKNPAKQDNAAQTLATPPPESPVNGARDPAEARVQATAVPKPDQSNKTLHEARSLGDKLESTSKPKADDNLSKEDRKPRNKKIPVIFFDEAHKLPALIQADDAMKAILDSLIVLTKQDRLAHTMLATSDPFFMTWLRAWNTAQHCQIISVGDCSKAEAKRFFEHALVEQVPEKMRSRYNFEELYQAFGGKFAHLSDYTTEFVNNGGDLPILNSSHFLQAHALLNLQLIHARPSEHSNADGAGSNTSASGFRIYSPLRKSVPAPVESDSAEFSVQDLLTVMSRLAPGKRDALPYFALCRELGATVVDGLVKARILELRWSTTVTEEGEPTSVLDTKREKTAGAVVVPVTPIIRFAMGRVLEEWKDELKSRD
ncbi:uncharacterized protein JCM15063_004463 [Sporobolomyces koalae]|uniref:uncharacterized protein n=1 Tax=Sporobolomyces koalae TaxID=500713 RepID=UPI00317F61B5